MTTDYTKLLQKLVPAPDGEPVLTLRVATVDSVNTDGTVDLELGSGVIVPNVPCLDTVSAAAGLVVQVLSARGSLLVIGGSSNGGAKGFVVRSDRITATGPITATTETVIQTYTFIAAAGMQYEVEANQSSQTGTAGDAVTVRLRWATGATVTAAGTQLDSKVAGVARGGTGSPSILFGILTVPTSGQVTIGVTMQVTLGSGQLTAFGAAGQINYIKVKAA
jgi:hypothetical protein